MPSRENDSVFAMVDLPVRPHYLEPVGELAQNLHNNLALRVGEVVDMVYPDDARSVSKRIVEYRVIVQHYDDETGSATAREYPHCVMINPFGGYADQAVWTPRIDKGRDKDDTGLGRGAKVLLLCVNGEQNSAVIIGGVRDEMDQEDIRLAKKLGHSFTAVFNGVSFIVSQDGEMSFIHKGPTEIDGKLREGTPDDVTAGFSLLRDGTILLGSRNDRNNKEIQQQIRINQSKRRIEMKADKGIHIGAGSEKMAKFTTYRRQQKQLHTTLMSLLTTLTTLVTTISTSFQSISTLHVIPIVGPMLASPAMGAIGVQFTAIVALIQAAQQAINAFEQQGSTYESRLNTND